MSDSASSESKRSQEPNNLQASSQPSTLQQNNNNENNNISNPPQLHPIQHFMLSTIEKVLGINIPNVNSNDKLFDPILYILQHILPRESVETLLQENSPFLHTIATIFLASIFFIGIIIVLLYYHTLFHLGMFLILLSIWHFVEYFMLSIHQTDMNRLSYNNFALFFKPTILLYIPIAEYSFWWLLSYYFNWKQLSPYWPLLPRFISYLGLICIIIGQFYRSLAIHHAGINFQYSLKSQRDQQSTLITNGIYSVCRHPSYSAMLLYSFGFILFFQIPILCLLLPLATYPSVITRIALEEKHLINMFGNDYIQYAQETNPLYPNDKLFQLKTYFIPSK